MRSKLIPMLSHIGIEWLERLLDDRTIADVNVANTAIAILMHSNNSIKHKLPARGNTWYHSTNTPIIAALLYFSLDTQT